MTIDHQAFSHQSAYSIESRKLLGVHYTPDAVIEYIVRLTLRPYFEQSDAASVRNLTIVDPACGSGLFLLKAFDVLRSFWTQRLGHFRAEEARHILENNLYGVDIDASAVRVAKERLAHKAKEFGVGTVDLEQTIRQGDALMRPARRRQLAMPFDGEAPFRVRRSYVAVQTG